MALYEVLVRLSLALFGLTILILAVCGSLLLLLRRNTDYLTTVFILTILVLFLDQFVLGADQDRCGPMCDRAVEVVARLATSQTQPVRDTPGSARDWGALPAELERLLSIVTGAPRSVILQDLHHAAILDP